MNKIALLLVLLSPVCLTACSTVDTADSADAGKWATQGNDRKALMDNDHMVTGSRLPSYGGHAVTTTSGDDYNNAMRGKVMATDFK